MLTQMQIKNFKRFEDVVIELRNPVVFIGPNNSGKTAALQALALWSVGVRKWIERRDSSAATKRTGVTINRREILNIPLLGSRALWYGLKVRSANVPIQIEIVMEGIEDGTGESWRCAMEFESVDPDNIRCRPIPNEGTEAAVYRVPEGARGARIAFLPPMSGLISQEDLLQPGSIERRLGEGRTAEVLRNLCYRLEQNTPELWGRLCNEMRSLFGVEMLPPLYNAGTGVLSMEYQENKEHFDLTSSGQGFRQTLLLLAHVYTNPRTTLLLDEPDAHLEILRQRQIYSLFSNVARDLGSQVMIATHSEIILNEAAQQDQVIAFIGKPHRMQAKDKVVAALSDYGFDHYVQAEQTGWVLYLEGATDLAILKTWAQNMEHPAQQALERPFVQYVANQTKKMREHFYALREAFPDLRGVALFDRDPQGTMSAQEDLLMAAWRKREIENYLVTPVSLIRWAVAGLQDDLFAIPLREQRSQLMDSLIRRYIPPVALDNLNDEWWSETKMTDSFLDRLFPEFYEKLALPVQLRKGDYYKLAGYMTADELNAEIHEKLDMIDQIYRDPVVQARLAMSDPTIDAPNGEGNPDNPQGETS